MEGAKNNLPDVDSQRAADKIAKLVSGLGKEDLLIVLVSGEMFSCIQVHIWVF